MESFHRCNRYAVTFRIEREEMAMVKSNNLDWYHRRTYLFVSEPMQGYGLYLDWMLQEAEAI